MFLAAWDRAAEHSADDAARLRTVLSDVLARTGPAMDEWYRMGHARAGVEAELRRQVVADWPSRVLEGCDLDLRETG